MAMSNAHGNTKRDLMRFLRANGIAPNVSNVERIGREVRRTESQNRAVEQRHKELEATKGIASTRDEKGDVHARVKRAVKASIQKRSR